MLEVVQTEQFRRWLERLRDHRARVRISARMLAISEGHFGDWKPVDRVVAELRINTGPGYRVYFMRSGATIIILLAGGDKRTQRRDIEAAKRLASEITDGKEIDP